MFKKNPARAIAILSFVIAIAGIVNHTFISSDNINVIRYKGVLDPYTLDWVFAGTSLRYNGYSFVNSFFDFLLLAGAVAYVASGYKQARLVRFIFSMVFLANVLVFIDAVIFFCFEPHFSMWIKRSPANLLFYLINIFWAYVSLNILNYFKRSGSLQTEIFSEGEYTQSYFVKASNWQRVLHPVIDTIVVIAIFSPMLSVFVHYGEGAFFRYMVQMEETWAEKYIYWIILALRLVYYLVCESVLGASPAKYLTKTRVIDYEGNKPSFKHIAIRTLIRLVPLESISFFTGDGWHDKWSETLVAKEE